MVFAIQSVSVYGGTPCNHFTHNNHDTLLIGEVIEVNEYVVVIKSAGFIISAGLMHHEGRDTRPPHGIERMLRQEAARQLRPEIARVYRRNHPEIGWLPPSWMEYFRVGDYVIASLNRNHEGDGFIDAWGIYTVDSLDYQALQVYARDSGFADSPYSFFAGLSGMFTEFVNSRGYGGYFIPVGERPIGQMPFFIFILPGAAMGAGIVFLITKCVIRRKPL